MEKGSSLNARFNPRGLLKAFVILLFAGSAVGCSVQGEITDITKRVTVPRLGQQMGFVSAASQNEVVSGYVVSSSVGHWSGGDGTYEEVSGYKVYTTVQGNLAAESTIEELSQ